MSNDPTPEQVRAVTVIDADGEIPRVAVCDVCSVIWWRPLDDPEGHTFELWKDRHSRSPKGVLLDGPYRSN